MDTITCSSVINNNSKKENRLSIQREISFTNTFYEPYKRWSTTFKFGKDGLEANDTFGEGYKKDLSIAASSSCMAPKVFEKVEILTTANGSQLMKQTIEFSRPQ